MIWELRILNDVAETWWDAGGDYTAPPSASTPRAFYVGRFSRKASPVALRLAAAAVAAVFSCTRRLSALNITRIGACITICTAISLGLELLAAPTFTGGRPAPAGATPLTGGRLKPAGTPPITGGPQGRVTGCAPPQAPLAATRTF
jgi:hypothetical protein